MTPFFGDLNQSETLSEYKPPLKNAINIEGVCQNSEILLSPNISALIEQKLRLQKLFCPFVETIQIRNIISAHTICILFRAMQNCKYVAKGFFHHLMLKISKVTLKQRGFEIVNWGYKALEEYIYRFSPLTFSQLLCL